MQVWQIGADGGFLAAPVDVNAVNGGQILMAPAERADVIVDFAGVPAGEPVYLINLGPDEPYGGGVPGTDIEMADSESTGQVMQFRVKGTMGKDKTTPPWELVLPAIAPPAPPGGPYINARTVSLNEEESKTVNVTTDADGNVVLDCNSVTPFGPTAALLGTLLDPDAGNPLLWGDDITENPAVGATETWEIHNFTEDAHPIHIHLVQFQIVDRQAEDGTVRAPEAGESGFKDTVIAYPGEITRVQARFDKEGLFVWHCHIVEHEDNEMMRPYKVG